MVGCASASTYQDSTEPPLRSASSPHVWDTVKVHPTTMFACLMACRTRLPRISASRGPSWGLKRSGVPQPWQRWRWPARSRQRLRSLPRPLGLGAREDRLPQPTESATPTFLRPQHHQVTSFKFHFQLGAPSGPHYSQAAWVRPCGMYPFYFMLLDYLVGGAPRAASSPKSLGPDPVMSAFLASIWNPLLRN